MSEACDKRALLPEIQADLSGQQPFILFDEASITASGGYLGGNLVWLDSPAGFSIVDGMPLFNATYSELAQNHNNSVWGWNHVDLPFGGPNYNDFAAGGEGADTMHGEGGDDLLYGGAGWGLGTGLGQEQFDTGLLQDPKWAGTPMENTPFGTYISILDQHDRDEAADDLYGDEGNDTLFGEGGHDYLNGGIDADLMYGGRHDDNMYGGDDGDGMDGDTMFGEGGHDFMEGGDELYYTVTREIPHQCDDDGCDQPTETVTYTYKECNGDLMFGNDGCDTMAGNMGFDTMDGGACNDVMWGDDIGSVDNGSVADDSQGNGDSMYGGTGNDTMYGGNEFGGDNCGIATGIDDCDPCDPYYIQGCGDRMWGNNGNDFMYGQAGDDTLFGGRGHDFMDGGSDDDVMFGGYGCDTMYGGDHCDIMDGGRNSDEMYGESGNDSMAGGAFHDTMSGGDGNDYMGGQWGNDYLMGDAGNDRIYGGTGVDTLEGGDGNDYLDGGRNGSWDSPDVLTGGAGNDVFAYTFSMGEDGATAFGVDGWDVITDFTANEDTLLLCNVGWDIPHDTDCNGPGECPLTPDEINEGRIDFLDQPNDLGGHAVQVVDNGFDTVIFFDSTIANDAQDPQVMVNQYIYLQGVTGGFGSTFEDLGDLVDAGYDIRIQNSDCGDFVWNQDCEDYLDGPRCCDDYLIA